MLKPNRTNTNRHVLQCNILHSKEGWSQTYSGVLHAASLTLLGLLAVTSSSSGSSAQLELPQAFMQAGTGRSLRLLLLLFRRRCLPL